SPIPEAALVPEDAHRLDVAEGAVVDTLHRFLVTGLITALGAGDDVEVVAIGRLVRLEAHASAGAVDADRLLGEDLLPRPDRSLQMRRPEARRRREDDQVAILDHALIRIEPNEDPFGGDVDLVAELGVVAEIVQHSIGAIAEGVADGDELAVGIGAEVLFDGA